MAACAMASDVPGISIRGKLTRSSDKQPVLDPGNNKPIHLKGDHDTMDVLNDPRLAGSDLEAIGHFTEPDHFTINPITSKSMRVRRKQARASWGVQTIGSFSLKDVLSTIGSPVCCSKALISA